MSALQPRTLKTLVAAGCLAGVAAVGPAPAAAAAVRPQPAHKAMAANHAHGGAATAPIAAAAAYALAPQPDGFAYKFEDEALESTWCWTATLKASRVFETRVVFNYQDDHNYLLLRLSGDGHRAGAALWRVSKGVVEKLGDPAVALPSTNGRLTVQRSLWRVRALWNGRTLLTGSLDGVNHDTWKFGSADRGGSSLLAARMQPTETVNFRDDFMRAQGPDDPEVAGQWHRVGGVWKTSGILGPRADAALNPNPFVFRSESGSALAARPESIVGQWFWSDYMVEAAVRPALRTLDAPLCAGVAAYRQTDGTALVGEIDFRTGTARLRQGSTILAESQPFLTDADQWHRLFLDPGPGTVRLVVDGVERVRWTGSGSGDLAQGEAGLVSQVGGGNYVDFDDVRIAGNDAFSDDFRTRSIGRWTDTLGRWQTRAAAAGTAARRVKLSAGPGLTLARTGTHKEGRIEAKFASHNPHGAAYGVVFAARDAGNYFLAKVTPRGVNIVQFEGGAGKVVGSGPAAATNGEVEVQWQGGAITASSGKATATAIVNAIGDGRAGAWAEGAPGAWSVTAFNTLGAAPAWGEGSLPERFTKDRLMQYWASNAALWQASSEDKSGTRWHVGDFFNDAAISLKLPVLEEGRSVTLYAGASPAAPTSGSRLVVLRQGDNLEFALAEAGRVLKTLSLPAAGAGDALRFARRPLGGGQVALRVALGDKALFTETAAEGSALKLVSAPGGAVSAATAVSAPAQLAAATSAAAQNGAKVGVLAAPEVALDWDSVEAQSSHVLDYSFTGAPTDWRAGKGSWNVSERWTCSPQWGFFAGVRSVNPTLWSRFALRGDWTLEAYLATPMDVSRGERGPTDLNLSVDGDGRDLASGYSFLFGANGRAANRIYRGDSLAKEEPCVLPHGNGSTHQDWFYIRLERRRTAAGLNFRYTVNGRQIWDYTDPQPLQSSLDNPGHIAFWTYNGGLSIARVRLWYSGLDNGESANQALLAANAPAGASPAGASSAGALASASGGAGAQPVAAGLLWRAEPAPLKNALGQWDTRRENLLQGAVRISALAGGNLHGVAITNSQSGGDFTTYIARTPFDAAAHATLKFRYKIAPGTLVNLYAQVDGSWREIGFTGNNTTLPLLVPGAAKPLASNGPPMGWGANVDSGKNIGSFDGVRADSAWHNASFDLLGALKKAGLSSSVEALAFAAPDRDYLRAGLGGNHLGATFSIADFEAPAPSVTPAGAGPAVTTRVTALP